MFLLHWQRVWVHCPAEKWGCCETDAFQMTLHVGLKSDLHYCLHNSISFNKIHNANGWNAASNHDRDENTFYKTFKCLFLCVKDSQLNVKWHSKQTKTFLARYKPWAENEWKQQKNLKTFRKPGQLLFMITWKCEDNLAPWKQNIRISTVLWLKKNKLHLSFSSFFLLTHLTVIRQFGTICPFIPTKTMFDFQNTTNSHCRCINSCGVIKKTSLKYILSTTLTFLEVLS